MSETVLVNQPSGETKIVSKHFPLPMKCGANVRPITVGYRSTFGKDLPLTYPGWKKLMFPEDGGRIFLLLL
jgi:hypothetical protein